MTQGGYIKVWRKMLDSEVMQDDWLCRLWTWCMLKAKWQDGRGPDSLKRGQFRASRSMASEEMGVSQSKFYRGLNRLKELDCIEIDTNSLRTTITICNYATYQDSEDESEQPVNSERTAGEQRVNSQRTASEQLILLDEEEEEGKKERKGTPPAEKFDPLPIVLPAALDTPAFRDSWAEWVAYRRDRRLSLRERTVAKQISDFARWGEPAAIEAINTSIRNGWTGVFESKPGGKHAKPVDPDAGFRAVAEAASAQQG